MLAAYCSFSVKTIILESFHFTKHFQMKLDLCISIPRGAKGCKSTPTIPLQQPNNTPATFLQHANNNPTTFLQHANNNSTTSLQHSYNTPTTTLKHPYNIPKIPLQHPYNTTTTLFIVCSFGWSSLVI